MTSHFRKFSGSWAVQDAKARFSELMQATVESGPQVVTKRGVETVVVVTVEEWNRATGKPSKNAIDLLLHDPRRFDMDLTDRHSLFGRREPPDLE